MLLSRRSPLRLGKWTWTGVIGMICTIVFLSSIRGRQDVSLSEMKSFQRSMTGRVLLWVRDRSMGESELIDPEPDLHAWELYTGGGNSSSNSTDNSTDCKRPLRHHAGYNNSCDYVKQNCQDIPTLFDYLSLAACNLRLAKWFAYIIMVFWLLVLVSLLATTADYFFVPPLNVLADKLKLTPAIAGITLLAVGNGAPDVFTAYAAIHNADDFPLQLSALLGASIFISTVVLGSVMLVAEVSSKTIKRLDMIRDILVYMVVVATVVGVSYDSSIHLWESALFLAIYIIYIGLVVALSFFTRFLDNRKKNLRLGESSPLINEESSGPDGLIEEPAEEELDPDELPGLTWPSNGHIGVKIQFVIEYPFSILRWLSIPPCDDRWTFYRRWFAIVFPVPAAFMLLIAGEGFGGFDINIPFAPQPSDNSSNDTSTQPCVKCMPLYALLLICGAALSVVLFFWTRRTKTMGGLLQAFLAFSAFIMSVAWLNVQANEVVSLLESLGLIMGVDTAILGLTVLAIGNSVGDLVADTTVARKTPAMGVSSCFGSPLLNDVLGLGIPLTAYTATHYPKPFTFDIHDKKFAKVKLSWIFLGISLMMSLIVFPVFRFSPPRYYAYVLYAVYVTFMLFSVLDEVNVLPVKL